MDEDQHIVATGLHHLPLRVRDSSTSSSINSTSTKFSSLTGSTLFHQYTPTPQQQHQNQKDVLFNPVFTQKGNGGTASSGSSFRSKRCPETLNLLHGGGIGNTNSNNNIAARVRSPTESSLGSIPDSATTYSATTYSPSTLASPLSSSYAGDLQDLMAATASRPASRVLHRHRPSTATCSTFVNDEDEPPVMVGCHDHLKITATYRDGDHKSDDGDEEMDRDENDRARTQMTPPSFYPSNDVPIKEESSSPPIRSIEETIEPSTPDQWENASTTSDDCSPEDVDSILDFTLQLVYGVDTEDADTPSPTTQTRGLVQRFVRELGQSMWQASPQPNDGTRNSAISSSSSNSSTPAGSGGRNDSQRGGKRKKNGLGRTGGTGGGGGGDDDGDDLSDGGDGEGYLPIKRPRPNPKEDENLRLSCPFRKRNPHRFNVRDHHSCAMTFFPKFAELRQHIVKQHKRDDPSAFVCDRCNRDFSTRKELRDHQRLPRDQMCDISDVDPESGIDGPTANKLLSRKRASGSSTEVQWREVWNILFPDDDDHLVRDYQFTPIIEHFELSNSYMSSFNFLKADLRDKMSNPATLETLATKFHQCFVETVERCIAEAQVMPYANRSNKRNEQLAAAVTTTTMTSAAVGAGVAMALPRKAKEVAPRPDSGVVMDDGSEESGSVLGGGIIGGRLSQRESMRTVRGGRRGSSLAPMGRGGGGGGGFMPPSRTSSAIFDGTPPTSLPTIPAMSMGAALDQNECVTMAPTDAVQAWTHGVPFPQAYEPMPDNFVSAMSSSSEMGMNSDFAAWAAQTFYGNGMAVPAGTGGGMEAGPGAVTGVDEFVGYHGR